MESKWGVSSGGGCSLDIRFVHSRRLGGQMWAQFNFLALKGVFRFLPSKPDDSEEEDCDDDVYDEEEFYLEVNDIPSKNCPSWKYCFRGKGPFGGEELRPRGKLCRLTFGGVRGTELTGSFDSSLTGRVDFTGVKTGPGSNFPPPEWEIIHYKWKEAHKS